MTTSFDIVICGAGSGGLTLAHALSRCACRVLLIEKQRRSPELYKGELIQPRSLEILRTLGLHRALRSDGALRVDRLNCRDERGRELASVDYRLLPQPLDHGLVHAHKAMTDVFESRLGPNVTLRRGVSAESLLRNESGRVVGVGVRAENGQKEQIGAALVVGADGRSSRTRSEAGIRVDPVRYPHQLLAFDIREAPELGRDLTMHLTPNGLRVLFQMPGERARLYVEIPVGSYREIRARGIEDWVRHLIRATPGLQPVEAALMSSLSGVQVASPWRFIAPSWSIPGFVLIGDTAHCVHPMAGQGMNAAIGDAWALAEEVERVGGFEAAAIDRALDEYVNRRRPQIEFVARVSGRLAALFSARTFKRARPFILARSRDNVRLRYVVTHNVAGLGANKLTPWDLACATGLIPDPRSQTIPALPRSY